MSIGKHISNYHQDPQL